VEIWQAAIVGVVQGVTEFLPISSSAHIVFSTHLLGVSEGSLRFTIFVHFGTLVAVFAALWYRVGPVMQGTIGGVGMLLRGRSPWSDERFRWGAFIMVGTIPAGVIGLAFKEAIGDAFQDPAAAGGFLIATGAILFTTRFARTGSGDVGAKGAITVGFAQALAILPGISRSGTTIATGMLLGVDRQKAAEFSFLLAIPVILGPSILTIGEVVAGPTADIAPLVVGFVAAGLSGYLSIRALFRFVREGRLSWFAYYCWIAGALAIVLF
jgi:undecaprenyl-diphosphatase